MIKLVAVDRTNAASHELDDLRLCKDSAKTDFDVIIGEKILKELCIMILPRLPGLLFQLN